MNEISKALQLVITKQKKELYSGQYFDLSLQLEIANEVEDEKNKIIVTKEMVKFKKALKFLDKKIEELEKEVKDFVSE